MILDACSPCARGGSRLAEALTFIAPPSAQGCRVTLAIGAAHGAAQGRDPSCRRDGDVGDLHNKTGKRRGTRTRMNKRAIFTPSSTTATRLRGAADGRGDEAIEETPAGQLLRRAAGDGGQARQGCATARR